MDEMFKRKKDGGFTLIELMIVIAVIGILAVVMVPKVGSIKSQAKSSGVDTNVRAVEAFVQSRIDYWATNGTAQWTSATAGIQPEIQTALADIKNPISLSTTIVSSTNAATSLLAPAGAAVTDALQIGGVASGSIPLGGVVVVSTGTEDTISIIITGYDANGIVTTTATITP